MLVLQSCLQLAPYIHALKLSHLFILPLQNVLGSFRQALRLFNHSPGQHETTRSRLQPEIPAKHTGWSTGQWLPSQKAHAARVGGKHTQETGHKKACV